MQINADQLARHLERTQASHFLVSGDEPLQMAECRDAIRRHAQVGGCEEHSVFSVDAGFDWNDLTTAAQSLSLFAARRLLEIRLPSGRPGEAGATALVELAQAASPDIVLLVISGKLDKTQRDSRWVQAIESNGLHVVIWPFDAQKLPAWLAQRFAARGLKPEAGVTELLAWHLEGNMLAAAQEVDKLAMLCHAGRVALADVEESLADSARFSVYQLVDAALAGAVAPARRMLASLRAEGSEPILMLWALARETRSLAQMAQELARGKPENAVLARAWAQRRSLVGKALRRHPAPVWLGFVQRCARLDRILKGRAPGDVWLELERLLLAIAGLQPFIRQHDHAESSA